MSTRIQTKELEKAAERLGRYLNQMDEADTDHSGSSRSVMDLQGKIAAVRERRTALSARRK